MDSLAAITRALPMLDRGYRSNPVLDMVTPDARGNKKMLWALQYQGPDSLMGGAAGGAKVVYDLGTVLTPFGWKLGQDLRVGDAVNNPDGSVARIIQVHKPNRFQVWRVRFHDGTYTDVGREHLWLAWRSGKRKKTSGNSRFGEPGAEVIETQELMQWWKTAVDQEARGIRPQWPCIPVCQEQPFNRNLLRKDDIDPYLLGFWLGDGHGTRNGIGFTSADDEHISTVLENDFYSRDRKYRYTLTQISKTYFRDKLETYNLYGLTSANKFVPIRYLYADASSRWAILQGLMDTDGTVDKRGQCYFCSTSQRLANNVAFLVQSLGGTATVTGPRPAYAVLPDGTKQQGLDAYHVYIKHRNEPKLFRLARKKSRCKTGGNMYRRVVSVEILPEKRRGRCITVSHPNGLYLTNDFIVTHNSHSLLSQALQYVDVPGYAALLVRAQYTDLSMAGGLMDKAGTLLASVPNARKKDGGKRWEFETSDPNRPAVLQFGHLGFTGAEYNYKSSEFQFIGVDEVTEIDMKPVLYLKSRLRRPQCPKHRAMPLPTCRECQRIGPLLNVPLRFRLASNPGGKFGEWVKNRYVVGASSPGIQKPYLECDEETQFSRQWAVHLECRDCKGSGFMPDYVDPSIYSPCPACSGLGVEIRHFIPARLKDNKHIDPVTYIQSLKGMDNPVEVARLLAGKWDVMEEGNFFKEEWFRYYDWVGNGENAMARLKLPGGSTRLIDPKVLEYFVTADTASKDKTQNDYTVAIVWCVDLTTWDLMLVDVLRDKILVPHILPRIRQLIAPYPVQFCIMEEAASGIGLIQESRTTKGFGLTILPYNPHNGDKVSRATGAMIRMQNGQVYFPLVPKVPGKELGFMSDVRGELIGFNALEHDDIVDNFSMAEWYVGGNIRRRNAGGHMPQPITGGLYPGATDVFASGGLPPLGGYAQSPFGVQNYHVG